MNKHLKLLWWGLFWGGISVLSAQPDFVSERIAVHTDRQLYVNGETIWFKVYVLKSGRNALANFSQVAYLELLSAEGAAISRIKVLLEEGMGNGAIELPRGMKNGIYQLRAYTRGMRNEGDEAFCKQELFILNPEQPLVRFADAPEFAEEALVFNPGPPVAPVASPEGINVKIKTRQTQYRQREKVVLKLHTSDSHGNPLAAQLSLSVALKAPDSFASFPSVAAEQNSTVAFTPREINHLPEDRGMRIRGKVVREGTDQGVAGVNVVLAFPGKRALVYSALSGSKGEFSFLLPRMFGLKQVVIQIEEKEGRNLVIQLAEEFHPVALQDSTPVTVLPPEWEAFAGQVMVNAQVGHAYRAFAPAPAFATPNKFQGISFFGEPDFTYKLDDFTRFPLPEFFYEVVQPVRVTGKYGEEELSLENEWENPQEDLEPLLLVDGVPVFDQRAFLQINNKLIESAEVVLSPVWLNPGVFDGVIQVSSFEGDARCIEFPETALRRSYLTFLPQKEFTSPNYVDQSTGSMPDFRNTLYWNPSVVTDAEGEATVEFFSSDAIGVYEVRVEGVSGGGGRFGSRFFSFEVVKPLK